MLTFYCNESRGLCYVQYREQAHPHEPLLRAFNPNKETSLTLSWDFSVGVMADTRRTIREIDHSWAILTLWVTTEGYVPYISQQAQDEESKN